MNDEQQRDQEQQLSPRRRTALVSYLAVLFAVAFLFVAVMMVMETKRLKTMNQELKNDSQKNAATLTNNINALQTENQQLAKSNEELHDKIKELEAAAESAAAEKEELQTQLASTGDEQKSLQQEMKELQQQLDDAKQKSQDAIYVSELLHQAMAADEESDMEGLQELLNQIEPLKDMLSPTEQDIYEELKIA